MRMNTRNVGLVSIMWTRLGNGEYQLEDGAIIENPPQTIELGATSFELQDSEADPENEDVGMWHFHQRES